MKNPLAALASLFGLEAAARPRGPYKFGEHAKGGHYTKKGPGRYHLQGGSK